MKTIIKAFICILICSLSISCQQTPNTVSVVGKDNLEKVFSESASFDLQSTLDSVPANWKETIALPSSNSNIVIDAPVKFPIVAHIPAFEVSAEAVDLDALKWFVEHVAESGYVAIPALDSSGRAQYSKEEIQSDMEGVSARIKNVDINHPEFSEEERALYIASQQTELGELQKQYSLASDDKPIRVSSYDQLRDYKLSIDSYIYDNAGSRIATLNINAGGDQSNLRASGFTITRIKSSFAISKGTIKTVKQATEAATEIIKSIGYDDIYSVVGTNVGEYGISVYFGRKYGQISYSESVNTESIYSNDYQYQWPEEKLRISFTRDAQEIRFVSWFGRSKIVRTINENVQIMPFSELQKIIRPTLREVFSWKDESSERSIVITQINLGYKRIPIQNSDDQYMVIPVWTLSGEIEDTAVVNGEKVITKQDVPDNAILVVSAIDGSLIYAYK